MSVWNQTPHVFESVSKSESWAAAERVQLHIYIEAVTVNTESASRGQMKTTEDGRAVFTLSPHNDCWTESTRRSGRLKCKCSAMEAGWRTELWLENAQRSNLFISWFQRRLIEAASSDFLYVAVQHTHTHRNANNQTGKLKSKQTHGKLYIQHNPTACFPSEFSVCQRHE